MGILLISVTLLASISQTLLYIWHTPQGTIYPLVHNFVEDYYQYLDIMRQGYDGWWVATSRLTPEVYPRMLVSVFLLSLGHMARIFHVSLPIAYFGARIFGGGVLMVLVYQLVRMIFPESYKKRIVAYCFVLFGTYVWGWGSDWPTVAPLTHAWTELDPIFRWSFVPHHLWSKVFMLFAFLLLLRPSSLIPNSIFLILVILMGFTNPVVYVTFIPTLALYLVLSLARGGLARLEWRAVGAIGVAGVVLLYHRYLQTNIFPWTSYLLWEQTLRYKVNPLDYAFSLGPTLLLFILALPTLWRQGRVGRLLIAWAASSWIMLYGVGPFVSVTPERFLGGYQFIPIAIGAAIWIFSLKGSHPLRLGVVGRMFKATPLAFARGGLMKLVLIVILLSYFTVGLSASFREHAGYVAANRNNPQVYVPKELMDAFSYLSAHGSSEDVVMAPYEMSTMIPGLTGRRVVAGHVMFTQDVGVKRAAINEFFSTRDPALAKRILTQYNVSWVLSPASLRQESGLVKRYANGKYWIYSWQ